MIRPPPPPPPDGAVQVPAFANVLSPRSRQLVPVKAAAPEVVMVRSVTHDPELAAPNDKVVAVSVKLLVMETGLEEDVPLVVKAPVMVCVVELLKLIKFGPAIVKEAKVFAPVTLRGPRDELAANVKAP